MKALVIYFLLSLSVLSQQVFVIENNRADFPGVVFDLNKGAYLQPSPSDGLDRYELDAHGSYQLRVVSPRDEDGFPDVYAYWHFTGSDYRFLEHFRFNGGLFHKCNIEGIGKAIMGMELRQISNGKLDPVIQIFGSSSSEGEALLDRLGRGPYLITCYPERGGFSEKPIEYRLLPVGVIGSDEFVRWEDLPKIDPNDPLAIEHERRRVITESGDGPTKVPSDLDDPFKK